MPEVEHRGCGVDHDPAMNGTLIDATTMEAIVYNIAGMAKVMCSHDGCGIVVGYHEAHNHQIACLHGPCTCAKPDYDFAAPPSALFVQLAAADSIQVHWLQYGKSREFWDPMTHPGSTCRRLIIKGEDGSVLVLTIGTLSPAIVVSLVCVRSSTCVWPLYIVKMWAPGPPPSLKADWRRDVVKVEADASSSASPGAVAFEELMLFLRVERSYLVGARPSEQLRLYKHICKQM